MNSRQLVLLFILITLGLILQQVLRYLSVWDELSMLNGEVSQLLQPVEQAIASADTIKQELQQAEQRHTELRQLLPIKLDADIFADRIKALAEEQQLKILATRTAIYSMPTYRRAEMSVSLQGSEQERGKIIATIESMPRLISINAQEPHGDNNIHLSLSIYAVEKTTLTPVALPECIEKPAQVWLPFLQEELATLYSEYIERCNLVQDKGTPYLRLRQLQRIQDENSVLERLLSELTAPPQ